MALASYLPCRGGTQWGNVGSPSLLAVGPVSSINIILLPSPVYTLLVAPTPHLQILLFSQTALSVLGYSRPTKRAVARGSASDASCRQHSPFKPTVLSSLGFPSVTCSLKPLFQADLCRYHPFNLSQMKPHPGVSGAIIAALPPARLGPPVSSPTKPVSQDMALFHRAWRTVPFACHTSPLSTTAASTHWESPAARYGHQDKHSPMTRQVHALS